MPPVEVVAMVVVVMGVRTVIMVVSGVMVMVSQSVITRIQTRLW